MKLVLRLTSRSNILISISILFLILFFLNLWFKSSINSFFSQDDFFHLRMIMDKDIIDIPSFFVSRMEGQTFYRPLSRETYNLLMYKLFNLNSLPYHLVNLSLILTITFLLMILVYELTGNTSTYIISGVIFIISGIHSIELYYLSSVQTLIAANLCLLSIIFYSSYLKSNKINYFLASFLVYSLSLFSHESVIILPAFLLILELFYGKFSLFSLPLRLGLFFTVSLLFFLSSSSLTFLPNQAVYQPNFNLKSIVNTFGWYTAWSFGLPEILVDFVGPNFKLNDNFTYWYKDYARIVFSLVFMICSMLALSIYIYRKSLIKNRFFTLCVLGFAISVLPFLFFPQHKFVYYLSFAIVWFSIAFGVILSMLWRFSIIHKILVIFVVLAFGVVAYKTIELNRITYWAAKRAKAADYILENFKQKYPKIDDGTIIYLTDDPSYPDIAKEWGTSSKQAFYILSGSDALRLFYNDASLRVYFESNGDLPKRIGSEKVLEILAKFPY